jgi:hypothetical protein
MSTTVKSADAGFHRLPRALMPAPDGAMPGILSTCYRRSHASEAGFFAARVTRLGDGGSVGLIVA